MLAVELVQVPLIPDPAQLPTLPELPVDAPQTGT